MSWSAELAAPLSNVLVCEKHRLASAVLLPAEEFPGLDKGFDNSRAWYGEHVNGQSLITSSYRGIQRASGGGVRARIVFERLSKHLSPML